MPRKRSSKSKACCSAAGVAVLFASVVVSSLPCAGAFVGQQQQQQQQQPPGSPLPSCASCITETTSSRRIATSRRRVVVRHWKDAVGVTTPRDMRLSAAAGRQEQPVEDAPSPPTIPADIIVEEQQTSCIRFASPLLEFGYPPAVDDYQQGKTSAKPLLLYIPGFDGTYLSAFFQYPELGSMFEVRCLVSTMEDRSTFDELKQSILTFLAEETQPGDGRVNKDSTQASPMPSENENGQKKVVGANNASAEESPDEKEGSAEKASLATFFSGMRNQQKLGPSSSSTKKQKSRRPVYVAGESFGGILAAEVALALLEDDKHNECDINVQGLVLVNAATCYDRSRLAAEGPPLIRLPKLLYFLGILKLLPMFLDDISLPQFLAIVQSKALPSLIDNPAREAYMGRLAFSLPGLLKFMPQETFKWRLEQWLEVGCKRMETKLRLLADRAGSSGLRTLIVAGENDATLPSIAEAERLAQLLPNSHVHVVQGVGHANTCGTCLDLAAIMRCRFPELQTKTRKITRKQKPANSTTPTAAAATTADQQRESLPIQEAEPGRIAMKEVASQGQGIYFGMEPRYDGNKIGLSPLLYWSKDNYRKLDGYFPH